MPPFMSYILLYIFEALYTLFVFDPSASRAQAGMMLILAFEVAFAVRVSKVQVCFKKVNQKLLRISRSYAAVYAIGMLMVMGLNLYAFNGERIAMMGAFTLIVLSKLMWERRFGLYIKSAPTVENQ